MSNYLSFDCEWHHQPGAADPLERRTWARIEIKVRGRAVTQIWDREADAQRSSIYVPAFPIARWLVANWWSLLFEAKRNDRLSPRSWTVRHCLRAADSGLLLPRLSLYSNGPDVVADWSDEGVDDYPNMPGQFVASGQDHLPRDKVEATLAEFVDQVLSRIRNESDSRAQSLSEDWDAIKAASQDEQEFCRAAGRMGLNPYAIHNWEDAAVAELLESALASEGNKSLVADFLDSTDISRAIQDWSWVESVSKRHKLGQSPEIPAFSNSVPTRPEHRGYAEALNLRGLLGLSPQDRIQDLADICQASNIPPLQLERQNHMSRGNIQATVGWRKNTMPLVVGPIPRRESSRRFLEARALYHALFACRNGPRLVTSSLTADQQASRRFAAELLIPRDALVGQLENKEWDDEQEQSAEGLAKRFGVSPWVIRYQLENSRPEPAPLPSFTPQTPPRR